MVYLVFDDFGKIISCCGNLERAREILWNEYLSLYGNEDGEREKEFYRYSLEEYYRIEGAGKIVEYEVEE